MTSTREIPTTTIAATIVINIHPTMYVVRLESSNSEEGEPSLLLSFGVSLALANPAPDGTVAAVVDLKFVLEGPLGLVRVLTPTAFIGLLTGTAFVAGAFGTAFLIVKLGSAAAARTRTGSFEILCLLLFFDSVC